MPELRRHSSRQDAAGGLGETLTIARGDAKRIAQCYLGERPPLQFGARSRIGYSQTSEG